jgi:hypothetical protein
MKAIPTVVIDPKVPCMNNPCLRAVILSYDQKLVHTEKICASLMVGMWFIALVLIEYKKAYRSVLWRIVFYLLVSSIFSLVYAINHTEIIEHCD